MARFHTLRIEEVREETDDCKSIAFEVPQELKESFQYKPGQYLTLKAKINGEEVRRSYSLCSSPLENELRVAVKKLEGGRFSTFANDVLKSGDVLETMAPMGNFFADVNPENAKTYVCFASGSGITPMLSIIKTVLQAEPNSHCKLFYGNRHSGSVIFKEEIEGLKNVYLERFEVFHFLTREYQEIELFNGRFDEEKMTQISEKLLNLQEVDEYFICGPEDMILCIQDFLKKNEVDKDKIHFELFTTPGAKKGGNKRKERIASGKISKILVKDSGSTYVFNLPQNTENILDAALKNGADLPYACKGGVCCTCKAKVIEGKVEMEVNYALEPEEVEQGYVLTCQCFPLTEKVVVDYDQAM